MDLTPQQQLFLKYYLDPKSETFSNALQSGLKAGYKEEYAKTITFQMPDWLSENINKTTLLNKANKNLEMALDGLLDDPEKGAKNLQWKATEMVQKGINREVFGDKQDINIKGEITINTLTEEEKEGLRKLIK